MVIVLFILLILKTFHFEFSRTQDTCEVEDFRCLNNKCVPQDKMCDGKNDCEDGHDERNCESKLCPASIVLKCIDNKRLPRSLNDITVETCWALHLLRNCFYDFEFGCRGTSIGQYIKLQYHRLGSRITDCNSKLTVKCSPEQWKCNSGECILKHYKCDGTDNCIDHSDERDCGKCHVKDFQCNSNRCVRKDEECDGIPDCADKDDEHCKRVCRGYKCANGPCIPNYFLCDGQRHCTDNSDENFCPVCNAFSWACLDRACIHVTKLCDGVTDCSDGGDERNCNYCDDNSTFTFQNLTCAEVTKDDCTISNISQACCYSCSLLKGEIIDKNSGQDNMVIEITVSLIVTLLVVIGFYIVYTKGYVCKSKHALTYDTPARSNLDPDPTYQGIDHYDLLAPKVVNIEQSQKNASDNEINCQTDPTYQGIDHYDLLAPKAENIEQSQKNESDNEINCQTGQITDSSQLCEIMPKSHTELPTANDISELASSHEECRDYIYNYEQIDENVIN